LIQKDADIYVLKNLDLGLPNASHTETCRLCGGKPCLIIAPHTGYSSAYLAIGSAKTFALLRLCIL